MRISTIGVFVGMIYVGHSLVVLKIWLRHGPLKGRPFCSGADVVWNHVESIGPKAYTVDETRNVFSGFGAVEIEPPLTTCDTASFPQWLSRFFLDDRDCFITFRARK
jgi:hypothetical protein